MTAGGVALPTRGGRYTVGRSRRRRPARDRLPVVHDAPGRRRGHHRRDARSAAAARRLRVPPAPARIPPMPMTGKERAALRAEAHHLDAMLHVGHQGLSPTVFQALDDALRTHELVKIALTRTA